MSDFYTYRNEVAGKKRKRSLMLALLIVLAAACAGVGWFWMQRDAQRISGRGQQKSQQREQTPKKRKNQGLE